MLYAQPEQCLNADDPIQPLADRFEVFAGYSCCARACNSAFVMDDQSFRTLAAQFDALAEHLRECDEPQKRRVMVKNMAALLREIHELNAGEHQSLDQVASEPPRTEATEARASNT